MADIDECLEGNGGCEDECENEKGDYECECHTPGYVVHPQYKHRCKGMYHTPGYMAPKSIIKMYTNVYQYPFIRWCPPSGNNYIWAMLLTGANM